MLDKHVCVANLDREDESAQDVCVHMCMCACINILVGGPPFQLYFTSKVLHTNMYILLSRKNIHRISDYINS